MTSDLPECLFEKNKTWVYPEKSCQQFIFAEDSILGYAEKRSVLSSKNKRVP
jgi:hypothetical protein